MAPATTVYNVPSGADLEPYFALMTTGQSVSVRLARGGTWSGQYRYQQGGGQALGAMHFIEAQPDTGSGAPLPVLTDTSNPLQLGIDSVPIHNLMVRNLRFTGAGPKALGNGGNLKLRKLEVVGARQGIVVQAADGYRWNGVIIAKCKVLDLDTAGSGEHGNGIYCARVDGLKILDNVIDHAVAPLDTLSHHLYIQNGNTGLVVRRNILSRSSSHALQARCGGLVDHNIVLDCPVGILMGGGTSPESGGITFTTRLNAVLGGGNIAPLTDNLPRGWAYYLENVKSGTLSDNVAADGVGGDQRGLTKDCSTVGVGNPGDPPTSMVGVLNVTGANYHRNHGTVHTDSGPSTGTTVSLSAAPNQAANLAYRYLGLAWDDIRAGSVDVLTTLAKIRQELGLRG